MGRKCAAAFKGAVGRAATGAGPLDAVVVHGDRPHGTIHQGGTGHCDTVFARVP